MAVLSAAVLHAGWNAIAKGVGDKLWLFERSAAVSFVLAVVLCGFAPLPDRPAWPWLVDGVGVRRSGSSIGYLAWLIALHCGTTVLAIIAARRWRPSKPDAPGRWDLAVLTGALSLLAYGLVLWAQTRGALAAVAALRECSVVVAAVLGAVLFREPMGRLRIAASVAVAAGVILLAMP